MLGAGKSIEKSGLTSTWLATRQSRPLSFISFVRMSFPRFVLSLLGFLSLLHHSASYVSRFPPVTVSPCRHCYMLSPPAITLAPGSRTPGKSHYRVSWVSDRFVLVPCLFYFRLSHALVYFVYLFCLYAIRS